MGQNPRGLLAMASRASIMNCARLRRPTGTTTQALRYNVCIYDDVEDERNRYRFGLRQHILSHQQPQSAPTAAVAGMIMTVHTSSGSREPSANSVRR